MQLIESVHDMYCCDSISWALSNVASELDDFVNFRFPNVGNCSVLRHDMSAARHASRRVYESTVYNTMAALQANLMHETI